MIESPLPTKERFSDRMKGILTSEQILERDSAGASHRILAQGDQEHFLGSLNGHLRNTEKEDAAFFRRVRSKVENLARTNLANHLLFRHLDRGQVTPLAEEALYWDIQLPEGQPALSRSAAQALMGAYGLLHHLPREAHRFYPVYLEGYNLGHGVRVGIYSALLAQKLGSDILTPEVAAQAGFLHDIGKAHPSINELVRLPEVLTTAQYERVKLHPLIGAMAWANMIKTNVGVRTDIWTLLQLHDAILEHHVRPDGRGYPEFIEPFRHSLVAKVVAVADSFDAMTSHRRYRRHLNLTIDYAHEELKRCSGMTWERTRTKGGLSERQFDPKLVNLFLELDPRPVFHGMN